MIITLAVIITRKDIAFCLVIVWALIGIIIKQIGNQSIVITASIGVIVIIMIALVSRMVKIKDEKEKYI
jgi:low affinity Fe/Cu permease